MARSVAFVGLLLISLFATLAFTSSLVGWARHGDVLTYIEWDEFTPAILWHDLNTDIARRFYPLTDDEGGYGMAWSPDGQRVAIIGSGTAGNSFIVVFDTAGRELSRVVNPYAVFADVSWFPDNERLLFVVYGTRSTVYAASIHQPNDWQVVLDERDGESYYDVSISPDGTQILFTLLDDSINVMNINGGSWQRLVETGYRPTWFPTGDHILYVQYEVSPQATPVLYALDINTLNSRRLVPQGGYGADSGLSPDGSQVAFNLMVGGDAYMQIFVMTADGTNLRQLTNNPHDHENPQWMP